MSLAEPTPITVIRDNRGICFDMPALPPQPGGGRIIFIGSLWTLPGVMICIGSILMMAYYPDTLKMGLFLLLLGGAAAYWGLCGVRDGLIVWMGPRLQVRITSQSVCVLARGLHFWPLMRIRLVNLDRLLLVSDNKQNERAQTQSGEAVALYAQPWSGPPESLLNAYPAHALAEAARIIADECTAMLATRSDLPRPHEVKVVELPFDSLVPNSTEQPPSSNAVLEQHAGGITIRVKSTARSGDFQIAITILAVCLTPALALMGLVACVGLWKDHGPVYGMIPLIITPLLIIGMWKLIRKPSKFRDRGTIDVNRNVLTITERSFGLNWRYRWDTSEIEGIEVYWHSHGSMLKIVSKGLRRKKFFNTTNEDEMHWIVRVLQRAVGL